MLDLKIFKPPGFKYGDQLAFKVYQKEQNTYQYIPFTSAHPISCFRQLIKGEAIRYARNSSFEVDFLRSKLEFKKRLLSRNYPTKFVDSILDGVHHQCRVEVLYGNKKQNVDQQDTRQYFKIRWNPVFKDANLNKILREVWSKTVEEEGENFQVYVPEAPMLCQLSTNALQNVLVRAKFDQ